MRSPPGSLLLDAATVSKTEGGATLIRVELVGYVTPSLNTAMRRHWQARGASKRNLAGRIKLQLVGRLPPKPFARARLTIERHSLGSPDADNLWGGTKDLVDCLLDPGQPVMRNGKLIVRHPYGLGIVADDNPSVLERRVVPVRVSRRGDQRTILIIEELA